MCLPTSSLMTTNVVIKMIRITKMDDIDAMIHGPEQQKAHNAPKGPRFFFFSSPFFSRLMCVRGSKLVDMKLTEYCGHLMVYLQLSLLIAHFK